MAIVAPPYLMRSFKSFTWPQFAGAIVAAHQRGYECRLDAAAAAKIANDPETTPRSQFLIVHWTWLPESHLYRCLVFVNARGGEITLDVDAATFEALPSTPLPTGTQSLDERRN
jgi:hypothetical protein